MFVCPCPPLRLSLWYKIQENHEKGPDSEAGRGSVWKRGTRRGAGCGASAGSRCPELAQHVDTEPVPDLKPPFQLEGKRWRDSRRRATSGLARTWFIFFFPLWSHWLTPPLFTKVYDFVIFGLAQILEVLFSSKGRSVAGSVREYCPRMCQEYTVMLKGASTGWTLVILSWTQVYLLSVTPCCSVCLEHNERESVDDEEGHFSVYNSNYGAKAKSVIFTN